MVRYAKENLFTTSNAWDQLQKVRLIGRSARKIPFSNKLNIQQRPKFDSTHLVRSKSRNVLWSHETKIQLLDLTENVMLGVMKDNSLIVNTQLQ